MANPKLSKLVIPLFGPSQYPLQIKFGSSDEQLNAPSSGTPQGRGSSIILPEIGDTEGFEI